MKTLFEKSVPGRRTAYLPPLDVPDPGWPDELTRQTPPKLPELSETDVSRHWTALERRSYGVGDGFYPLGSCTMKYNPKIAAEAAALPGFTEIHPLQPPETVRGCREVLRLAEQALCAVTGMDAMTFQPAAGAHGEFTGVLLIKKYHEARGDSARRVIVVPDSAHGTNPATAAMCGMTVRNIPSGPDGRVDPAVLRSALGPGTAGLMLTNPNTLGLFETGILEITRLVHQAGGLVYYDGANLNAVMGAARPGDMGFDCVHLNLHKTFAAPHGGGGPGSGAVGCRDFLAPYLPERPGGAGRVSLFHGNFLVVVKALAYILALGGDGLTQASEQAVLNANYLKHRLSERFTPAVPGPCMHEFVLTLEREARERGVTASDIAKGLIDGGIHPPTVYFPLIVREALMVEPTETEGQEGLDAAADLFIRVYDQAMADPAAARAAPAGAPVGRPDETAAARNPKLRA